MIEKKKKIRVGHLIYSPAIGGSETCAIEICSKLNKNEFEPVVLFMFNHKGPIPGILQSLGIPFFYLNHNRLSRIFGSLLLIHKLKKLKLDILHIHHVPLFRVLMHSHNFLGIKGVVLTEHAKFSISKSKKLQATARKAAGIVKYFTVVSNNLADYFQTKVHIPANLIHVIQNGIDTEKFNSENTSNEFEKLIPLNFKGKTILSVGRLTDAKDYKNLLQALKLLNTYSKYYLVIIGDGEKKHELEMHIKKNRLNDMVLLAGGKKNIEKYFKSDLFVLSSKREGLPMVILEAMASGTPVIATSVGGIPDLIKHNYNGVLVPPEDPQILADEIFRVAMDTTLLEKIKQNAVKTITMNHSSKVITEKYMNLYKNIIT